MYSPDPSSRRSAIIERLKALPIGGWVPDARSAGTSWLAAVLLVLVLGWLAARSVLLGGIPLWVTVDGHTEAVRSTAVDVRRALIDLGLDLRPEDHVQPGLDTPLHPDMAIDIRRARKAMVTADGNVIEIYSHAATARGLVEDAGLELAPHDEVWLNGQPVPPDTLLPIPKTTVEKPRFARSRPWVQDEPVPVRLQVRRAVRIVVDDGTVPYPIFTTADTIGEALLREELTLYLGDLVQPSLGTPVHEGLRVRIERSTPLLVTADGRTWRTRTRGKTVGDALTELGMTVTGSDRVTPEMETPVVDNLSVQIVRVQEIVVVEREPIPFDSVMVPDDELEIDQQRLVEPGAEGEYRRRYRVVYEDGQEISRTLTDDWVAAEPVTRVTTYGRKIVSRTLETPHGTVSYWRKIRMRVTAYSKSTAGVSPDAPWFGITRSGLPMQHGIVAVDPTVLPLGSRVYVFGYGEGLAADTGGGVRGKWIDLGYDDENLRPWSGWTDVYILDPPPAPSRIRWVLPNWPPR